MPVNKILECFCMTAPKNRQQSLIPTIPPPTTYPSTHHTRPRPRRPTFLPTAAAARDVVITSPNALQSFPAHPTSVVVVVVVIRASIVLTFPGPTGRPTAERLDLQHDLQPEQHPHGQQGAAAAAQGRRAAGLLPSARRDGARPATPVPRPRHQRRARGRPHQRRREVCLFGLERGGGGCRMGGRADRE